MMRGGEGEDGEALRQVFFQPSGQFGGAFGVEGDDFLEPLLGRRASGAVEDTAEVPGDLGALLEARDAGLSVLLAVELAALPGDGAKDGFACGGQAGMVVADDEGDTAEAALDEALEKGPPRHFRFTEGDAHPQDDALAFGRDAEGDEDGAVAPLAVVADLFVTGVADQVEIGCQGPVAPFFGVRHRGVERRH